MRTDDSLNRLTIDSSWLQYVGDLKSLSGTLLAVGIVLATAGVTTGAMMWATKYVFGAQPSQTLHRRVTTSVVAAIILGSLSAMVGWGETFDMTL